MAVLTVLTACKDGSTAASSEGPFQRVIVTTTVHTALFRELGAGDFIVDTCDIDVNNPDIERIVSLDPDAIFLSPYDGVSYEKIRKLGIPIIEMADYLEPTPLKRAAWMKYYGKLLDREKQADSLYNKVETAYTALADSVKGKRIKEKGKSVFSEKKYGDVWYVAGDSSYIAALIRDAGGEYVFSDVKGAGSEAMSPEKVFERAQDADIWLIKYDQATPLTLDELSKEWALYKELKAYKTGNVFGCNLTPTHYYEETPFHPERLLRDYIIMLSPGILNGDTLRYYKKIK